MELLKYVSFVSPEVKTLLEAAEERTQSYKTSCHNFGQFDAMLVWNMFDTKSKVGQIKNCCLLKQGF